MIWFGISYLVVAAIVLEIMHRARNRSPIAGVDYVDEEDDF